jgi:hypothetical protein
VSDGVRYGGYWRRDFDVNGNVPAHTARNAVCDFAGVRRRNTHAPDYLERQSVSGITESFMNFFDKYQQARHL